MDARAVCMKSGRLYAFSFGNYLSCLDAKTGDTLFYLTKQDAPDLFAALGEYQQRQDWRSNWRTTALLRCSDQALYFAGPALHFSHGLRRQASGVGCYDEVIELQ